jgi:hypothetical protein
VTERPGRRLAFRIVAAALGFATIAFAVPFAISAFVDDEQSVHRLHNLAGVFGFAVALGIPLLICAWRPWSIGPFWVAVASGVAGTIAGAVSGDFVSGVWYSAPIAIVALVILHPARPALTRFDGIDVPTAVLTALAVVPALAFALTQAELQRNGTSADPHADLHHYSGMASYALWIVLGGAAASLRVTDRRVGAWIVGVGAAGLGLSSLLLSDHVGAFEPPWSWLALAWGIAVVATTMVPSRREVAAG